MRSRLTTSPGPTVGDQLAVLVDDDPDGRTIHVAGVGQPLRLHPAHARLLVAQVTAILDTVAAAPPTPARGTISDKQRGYILALMGEYGITERPNRLAAMSKIVGRPVASTNHLSRNEASRVIEVMKAKVEPSTPDPAEVPF